MELEFLGTSSATSTETRNVSSLLLRFNGTVFMVDCGEGTGRQMLRSQSTPNDLTAVLITHLHSDHIFGLPGLGVQLIKLDGDDNQLSLGNSRMVSQDRRVPLFAPQGLSRIFHGALNIRNMQYKPILRYPMDRTGSNDISWCNSTACYNLFNNDTIKITAVPIKHTAFCVGYIFEEVVTRGRFRTEFLLSKGIEPGPIFKEWTAGKSVTSADGTIITPEMALYPARKARKVVVLGDTFDPSEIAQHAMDCDVLVHEATCTDEERTSALRFGHSTAGMAGAFARHVRAKNLILNHFSPRNFRKNTFDESMTVSRLVAQARAAYGSDRVFPAHDFYRFEVPRSDQIPSLSTVNRMH